MTNALYILCEKNKARTHTGKKIEIKLNIRGLTA